MSFVSHILRSVWNLQLRFVLEIGSVRNSWSRVLNIQFSGSKFLYDVSRLGVENPKECLIGKVWYFLPHMVDVVDSVTFG